MRIAFDVGGTFTDVVFRDDLGQIHAHKLLSLLETLGTDISALVGRFGHKDRSFIHATTTASNTVLESKLAPVALITTSGFRDVLEMRAQRAPSSHDRDWMRPAPVVPRSLRFEVRERILASGAVDQPLNLADVEDALKVITSSGVQAVAICLMNAYLWPQHELEIEDLFKARAPHIDISTSSKGFAQIGEYERTSTTAINAALMPILKKYFDRLEDQLDVKRGSLLIMQSTGGLMKSDIARQRPVHMIESGPAAGVLAAARLATEKSLPQILAFDMGGTTAKISVVDNGVPLEKSQSEIGGGAVLSLRMSGGVGHVVKVPSIDVVEVGAGGGSIAQVEDGVLRVGPQGAGAEPGPICYRRGGKDPTVTDANLALGYINPQAIAAGTLELDAAAAREGIAKAIGGPLNIDGLEAAFGIVRLADSTMTRAIRAATIERGLDPRKMTMVAYGGSGPLHAARLAASVGISRIYIPRLPGLFSAVGLLLADYRQDAVRGLMRPVSGLKADEIERLFGELEQDVMQSLLAEGAERSQIRLNRELDVQYQDQYGHLRIAVGALPTSDADMQRFVRDEFRARHVATYGYGRSDPEFVLSARVVGSATASDSTLAGLRLPDDYGRRLSNTHRDAYFGAQYGVMQAAVVSRASLASPAQKGPAIIEEPDTTVLVPPLWQATCDAQMNLILTRHA